MINHPRFLSSIVRLYWRWTGIWLNSQKVVMYRAFITNLVINSGVLENRYTSKLWPLSWLTWWDVIFGQIHRTYFLKKPNRNILYLCVFLWHIMLKRASTYATRSRLPFLKDEGFKGLLTMVSICAPKNISSGGPHGQVWCPPTWQQELVLIFGNCWCDGCDGVVKTYPVHRFLHDETHLWILFFLHLWRPTNYITWSFAWISTHGCIVSMFKK